MLSQGGFLHFLYLLRTDYALITHSTCAPHMEERCGCFDGRGLRACFLTFSALFQVLMMAVVRADGGARRRGERGAMSCVYVACMWRAVCMCRAVCMWLAVCTWRAVCQWRECGAMCEVVELCVVVEMCVCV
jgi:hypothetical protein